MATTTQEPQVVIARRVSECDVVPFTLPMPYSEAIAALRGATRKQLDRLELVYVDANGKPGRLASWSL